MTFEDKVDTPFVGVFSWRVGGWLTFFAAVVPLQQRRYRKRVGQQEDCIWHLHADIPMSLYIKGQSINILKAGRGIDGMGV